MATSYFDNFNHTTAFSDTSLQLHLTAGNEQTWTVPGVAGKKWQALLEYASDDNVFVGLNTTAASPSADSQTTTAHLEYKPKKRFVVGGDVLHFVTPDTTVYMGVTLRALP